MYNAHMDKSGRLSLLCADYHWWLNKIELLGCIIINISCVLCWIMTVYACLYSQIVFFDLLRKIQDSVIIHREAELGFLSPCRRTF